VRDIVKLHPFLGTDLPLDLRILLHALSELQLKLFLLKCNGSSRSLLVVPLLKVEALLSNVFVFQMCQTSQMVQLPGKASIPKRESNELEQAQYIRFPV